MNVNSIRWLFCLLMFLVVSPLQAAPGDILFQDNFERSNPGTVGNGWTVTPASAANCTGVAAVAPTATITVSGSGSTSVSSVTVNGVEILSGTTSASNQRSTVASRIDANIGNGFSATSNNNVVTITVPWSAAGYLPVVTASGGMTFAMTANAGSFGNTGCAGIDSDVTPWNVSTNLRANPTKAMFTRWSTVTVDSPVINLAGKPAASVTFWVRRGSDCFSEWPGNNQAGCNATLSAYTSVSGEEFQVQYKNSSGTWVVLSQYPTDGPPGEIFRPVIDLPADALHAGFQLRFYQPGGSGSNGTTGGAPGVRGYDYWHADDVVVTEQQATNYAGAFCDTFEGDLSRWSISGIGNASIGSTYFQTGLHGMDMRWRAVTAATRPANITGVTGNITYWLKRGTGNVTQVPNTTGSDKPEAGEDLVVEYLTTSGTWAALVPVGSFLGSGTAGQVYCPAVDTNCTTATPTTNSIAIASLINPNLTAFQLRFRLLGGSGYDMDYWHLDNVCVGAGIQPTDLSLALVSPLANSTTMLAPGQTSTIAYTVTNNGPNTEPGSITIVAALPIGLNYISSSGTNWTCSTTAVLTCTRTGPLAVGASSTVTVTVQVDVTAAGNNLPNTATVGGQSTDTNTANNTVTNYYSFGAPKFEAYEPSTTAGAISGRIYTKLAGVPFTLSVIARNNTAINTSYNKTATVDLIPRSAACVAATPALSGVTVTPSSYTYTGAGTSKDNGIHAFSFTAVNAYSSVQVRISDNNGDVGCSSDAFAIRPTSLVVTSSTANADGAGASRTNPPLILAGANFSLTATAVDGAATPNTLTGYDGTPVVNSALLQPHAGAGTAGTLTGTFGVAVSGVASGTSFTYSEVGYLRFAAAGIYDDTFTAVDQSSDCTNDFSNALDASGKYGCKFGNDAATVYFGRFIPDHFDTAVTQGCTAGGYTYSGQPFALSATARNKSGAVTQNYHGAGTLVLAKAITLSDANVAGVGTLAPVSAAASTFANGVASLTPSYTFTNRQTAPTAIKLRAVESAGGDGVSSATGTEGTTTIRSGRVHILNAYGSERLDLPMTLTVEYWNGSGWVKNTDDSCTTNVTLAKSDPVATDALATTDVFAWDTGSPGASGLGYSTAGTAAQRFNAVANAGNFNLNLRAPQKIGAMDITVTVPVWLQYGWTSAASGNPVGRATFGAFKSPLIYRRENY